MSNLFVMPRFSSIPTPKIVKIFWGCFLCALISTLLMNSYQAALTTYNIMDFEFSGTGPSAYAIMETWGEEGLYASIMINWLDYLFMVGYGGLIWSIILLLGRKWLSLRQEAVSEKDQIISAFSGHTNLKHFFTPEEIIPEMAFMPLLAVFLDAVENANLLMMQYNATNPTTWNAGIAYVCASLKFGLVGFSILFIPISIVMILYYHHLKKRANIST